MISIHGRTLKQLYSGDADFSFIQQVKSRVACPVMANGGISSYQMAQEVGAERGFDGVMIGQGAIGNPWIFTPHEPNWQEKIAVIKEHLLLMIACDLWFEERGEKVEDYRLHQPQESDLQLLKAQIDPEKEYRGIVEFRKYLFQYIKGAPNSREWKQKMIPIKTVGGVMRELAELERSL